MQYFIVINDVQQGPFSIDELRQRNITSDTLVWAEGMPQWTPAWQVEELRPLFYVDAQTAQTAAQQQTPPPPPYGSRAATIRDPVRAVLHRHLTSPKRATARRCSPMWGSL